MASVSGQKSKLNPNAPSFFPGRYACSETVACVQRSATLNPNAPPFLPSPEQESFGSWVDDEFEPVNACLSLAPPDHLSPAPTCVVVKSPPCKPQKNTQMNSAPTASADHGSRTRTSVPLPRVERNSARSDQFGCRKSKSCKLQFHQPRKNNVSSAIAWIPKDVSSGGAQRWNLSLVGQLWGGEGMFNTVCNTVNRLWGRYGRIEVSEAERGFYFFRFPNERTMSWVLEGGPWHISNYVLTLRKWEPNLQLMMNSDDSSIPVWITLRGVPVELMTQEGLSRISSVIGNPLCMDRATANHSRVSYARVCVEVELNAEIPKSVTVQVEDGTSIDINVSCFMKPVKCANCQVFGHKAGECGRKADAAEKPEPKAKKFTQQWIPKVRSVDSMDTSETEDRGDEINVVKPFCDQSTRINDKGKGIKIDHDSVGHQVKSEGESSKEKGKIEIHYNIPASSIDLLRIEENDVFISAADLYKLNRMGLLIQRNIESIIHDSTDEEDANYWPLTPGQLLQV